MYLLKPDQPDFDVVDGLFAGRKYKAGQKYDEVPPEYVDRFGAAESPPSVNAPASAPENAKDQAAAIDDKGGKKK